MDRRRGSKTLESVVTFYVYSAASTPASTNMRRYFGILYLGLTQLPP